MGWKAIARYEVGTSHNRQELPCQDYGGYAIFEDVILGVVADGAGSAKYSDLGSQLAVETVINWFKNISETPEQPSSSEVIESSNLGSKSWIENPFKWFNKPQKNDDKPGVSQPSKFEPLNQGQTKELFAKIVNKVIAELRQEAEAKEYDFHDLACTLLIFIATPHWLGAMQIGDGFIVVRSQDADDYQLLFPPDKGEFANETTFITSKNALEEMQVTVIEQPQKFICASTDGLEKLAIRFSDWQPFKPFFQPLEEYLQETAIPEDEDEYIRNFLTSERLNARTDDDKTLLLCLWEKN